MSIIIPQVYEVNRLPVTSAELVITSVWLWEMSHDLLETHNRLGNMVNLLGLDPKALDFVLGARKKVHKLIEKIDEEQKAAHVNKTTR